VFNRRFRYQRSTVIPIRLDFSPRLIQLEIIWRVTFKAVFSTAATSNPFGARVPLQRVPELPTFLHIFARSAVVPPSQFDGHLGACPTRKQLFGGGPECSIPSTLPISHSSDDIIELSDSEDDISEFVPNDWIGCGKVWIPDMPRSAVKARNSARDIPTSILASVIPNSTTSVADVELGSFFPRPVPSCDQDDLTSFSLDPPNILVGDIASDAVRGEFMASALPHLISAIPYVSRLRGTFNASWLAGYRSIRLSTDSHRRYPLWVEKLLGELDIAQRKQVCWEKASDWLHLVMSRSLTASSERTRCLALECFGRWDVIPWDVTIPGLGQAVHLTSRDLSVFLSDDWLNDEMVNAGTDYILRQLPVASPIRIVNCLFLGSLRNFRASHESYTPRRGSKLDRSIMAGEVDTLYVPLHTLNSHWTLMKVDLANRQFSYHDSLHAHAQPPQEDLLLVTWWIQGLLPQDTLRFESCPWITPLPQQHDTFSCGVIVLSSLASLILGYLPWRPESYVDERMLWFLRLSDSLLPLHVGASIIALTKFYLKFHLKESERNDEDYLGCLPGAEFNLSGYTSDSSHASSVFPCIAGVTIPSGGILPCSTPLNAEDLSTTLMPFSDDLPSLEAPELEPVDLFPSAQFSSSPIPFPADIRLSSPKQSDIRTQRKRKTYTLSDTDSNSDSNESRAHTARIRRVNRAGARSHSWAHAKALNASARDPAFKPIPKQLQSFRAKIRDEEPNADPKARFDPKDIRKVWCSSCAEWIIMRTPYDTKRWKEHRQSKKCQARLTRGLVSTSVTDFFSPKVTSHDRIFPSLTHVPCPGLTREAFEKVDRYLLRTTVLGGGAPSRKSLAAELFPQAVGDDFCWADLTPYQKKAVLRLEANRYLWRNNHAIRAVMSSRCEGDVLNLGENVEPTPCNACRSLLTLHTFQVALNRPMPSEENMKKVPKVYRGELEEIYLKYRGVRQLVEMVSIFH
jgi:hypothetical protein